MTERKGAADGHSAAVPLHRLPEGKIYESMKQTSQLLPEARSDQRQDQLPDRKRLKYRKYPKQRTPGPLLFLFHGSIHLSAVADFFASHKVLVGRELEEHRLKCMVVDLAHLISSPFPRNGLHSVPGCLPPFQVLRFLLLSV